MRASRKDDSFRSTTAIIDRLLAGFCHSWQAHVFLKIDPAWADQSRFEDFAGIVASHLGLGLQLVLSYKQHGDCCPPLLETLQHHVQRSLLLTTLPGLQDSPKRQFDVLETLLAVWEVPILLSWLDKLTKDDCILAALANPLLETATEVLGKAALVDRTRDSLLLALETQDQHHVNRCCQQLFRLCEALDEPPERRFQPLLRQLSSSRSSMLLMASVLQELLPTMTARQVQVCGSCYHAYLSMISPILTWGAH